MLESCVGLSETDKHTISRGGYVVLDNILKGSCIRSELERDDHVLSSMSPAKVASESESDRLVTLLQKFSLRSSEGPNLGSSRVRGDNTTFVDAVHREGFDTQFPCLSRLVKDVKVLGQEILSIPCCTASVQVACYPGDGKASYPRHCDVSHECLDEHDTTATNRSKSNGRLLTAIYYLNENWNEVEHGGCLRLYGKTEADIAPEANRLVIFRSDCVEHEVLPSFDRCRWAATVWLYPKTAESENLPSGQPSVHNVKVIDAIEEKREDAPLHLTAVENEKTMQSTIFVSIASYRDSETVPTLYDLFSKARSPKRLRVGLWLQVEEEEDGAILDGLPTGEQWWSQVRCEIRPTTESAGPCPARALCQAMYEREDYFLQIDSHMRFRQNWDTFLIDNHSRCPSEKSILSTYPVDYRLPNEMSIETRPTMLIPTKFGPDGMLRQSGKITSMLEPTWTGLVAAGFLFGRGQVVVDVPYNEDLRHLFFGEEISLAVRLFTHGYEVFAPTETVCNHLWTRSHRVAPSPALNERASAERSISLGIVRQETLGKGLGVGAERTAEDFAKRLGVDFGKCTIDPETEVSRDNVLSNADTEQVANILFSFLQPKIE